MVKKIGKRDFWLRIGSFLIAIGLWFYVAYAENPNIEIWFHGVNVTYLNDAHLEGNGMLRMKDGEVKTVSLKLRGNRRTLLSLSSHDISASIDLSGISRASSYSLPIGVNFPVDGITVIDKKPYNIHVMAENVIHDEFNVEVVLDGTPAEGYVIEDFESSIENVSATGIQSIVENIKRCVAVVDINGITAKKSLPVKLQFEMEDGSLYEGENVTLSNTYTTVTLNVYVDKLLPVKANITGADGVTLTGVTLVGVRVTPDYVKASGPPVLMNETLELLTEAIPLSFEKETETYTAKLQMPEGMKLADETVSVEVSISKDDVISGGR